MSRTLGYYILQCKTRLMQFLPMKFHYLSSFLLYALVYHIVGYRKKVVFDNLHNSFPEKSEVEIKKLAKRFYKHFADTFIETLYFAGISKRRIEKRIEFQNIELLNSKLKQGRSIVVVMGHYNNWECSSYIARKLDFEVYFIYQKLRNKTFNQFYLKSRQRWGAKLLERQEAARKLMTKARNNEPTITFFLSDQSPAKVGIQYWTNFLNQDTPVFLGPEKISRKTDSAVVFMHVRKKERGKYVFSFQLIEEHPCKVAEYEITNRHVRLLEEMIVEDPPYWLWSHRRWKHKRE